MMCALERQPTLMPATHYAAEFMAWSGGRRSRSLIGQNSLMVVEHLGEITGYSNGVGFFTHTVADSNRSLMALIAAAPSFPGPGFFLPTTNFEVFNWCLQQGLRLVAQATYMTIGLFNEPDGAWLPGVLY